VTRVIDRHEAGSKIGGYTVERAELLERLDGTYYELRHQPTRARHIHVAVPDDNNTYCVLFPTVPEDSTGVAHILEHVVLAGSRNFPFKDPFFSMLPRSLKTFMNAFTSSDWTAYPFSTRNEKDFFNLLQVYLDATFFPLLQEPSFKQEGHRLEYEDPDDPSSGLRFKGVVFNEMKGAMAAPASRLEDAVSSALFPDLTYAHNSGGDPAHIPDLTWEALREFHARHYHPSNAHFYTYGDLPLPKILEAIEERALSGFEAIDVHFPIPDQPRFTEPKQVQASYPLGESEETEGKSQVLVSWLTTNSSDSYEVLALSILADVLFGNPAAPLYKALIDSGLGGAMADMTGFHTEYREALFAVGLKATDTEHADRIEQIVFDTLEQLATDGIDPALVDASVHKLEIRSREISNSGFPFSLKVFFRVCGPFMYGGDPYAALRFDDDVERIQRERAAGPIFENLIRRWLLDNGHRARVVLAPDKEMEGAARGQELERLAKIEEGLSEEDTRRIVEGASALKERQESKEDTSLLPTLEISDVPLEMEDVPHTVERRGQTTIGLFPQPTNGLVYVDLRTSFQGLGDRLKDKLTVFSYVVPKMGTSKHDHVEMAQRINALTGGINAAASIRTVVAPSPGPRESFTLSGKALARNSEEFVEIVQDLVGDVQFDRTRLRELIAEQRTRMETSVLQAGHAFAQSLATSKLSLAGALQERLSGLSQLNLLRELNELDDAGLDGLIHELEAIRDHLFRSSGLEVCLTAESGEIELLSKVTDGALATLPDEPADDAGEPCPVPPLTHEARTTSLMVAFNAKVFPAPGFLHPDAPALSVLGSYLQSTFVHREVRESGGAYGGYSSFNHEAGTFWLGSYRDPHITRTYENFERAVRYVLEDEIDPQDLKEAMLSTCGRLDPLLSPDTKGRRRFFNDLAGYTIEEQARFKQGVLSVTDEDLRRVAKAHLSGDGAAMATVASPAKIEEANKDLGGIFEVSVV
jgi:presequence protease